MCPNSSTETVSIAKSFLDGAGHRHTDKTEVHDIALCRDHLALLNEGKLRPPR